MKVDESVKSLDPESETIDTIILVSQEEEKFTIPKRVGLESELVKTMIEGGKKL